jgi:hypothetical protein
MHDIEGKAKMNFSRTILMYEAKILSYSFGHLVKEWKNFAVPSRQSNGGQYSWVGARRNGLK